MGADFCQRIFLHLLILTGFFFFKLLLWCITLIDLCILKDPCILRINPTWSWCMKFLMSLWILLAKILLRIFAYVHLWCWSVVFFSVCCLCLVFVSGWWQTYRISLEAFLSLQLFESFKRIGISSSLNIW